MCTGRTGCGAVQLEPWPLTAVQAVGDIVVGSVLGPSSQRANEARIAMFLAGFPETVPVRTVNRRAPGLLAQTTAALHSAPAPHLPSDGCRSFGMPCSIGFC